MDRKIPLILVLLLVCGALLTLSAYIFGIFPFDLRIHVTLHGIEAPLFVALMTAVSLPGDGSIPVIITLAVAAVCAWRRKWIEAAFVLAASASAAALAGMLKVLVGRPRPPAFTLDPRDLFHSVNTYAYPSGHVLLYVVFYGFLAYLAWKYLAGHLRWIVIILCAALIVLIGPSRIVLGEHWASDVIGSYLIGAFWLIILILLYEMVLEWRSGVSREETGGSHPRGPEGG